MLSFYTPSPSLNDDYLFLDTATRHTPFFQASMSLCATRQTHSCMLMYHYPVALHRTHRDGYAANTRRAPKV
jgi:hypothetical protein